MPTGGRGDAEATMQCAYHSGVDLLCDPLCPLGYRFLHNPNLNLDILPQLSTGVFRIEFG
jgi:hypothetical protein